MPTGQNLDFSFYSPARTLLMPRRAPWWCGVQRNWAHPGGDSSSEAVVLAVELGENSLD